MMAFLLRLAELCRIHQFCEVIEVKHRIVLAVLAEERRILTEVHILQMISNEASIASLYAFAKIVQKFILSAGFCRHYFQRFYHIAIAGRLAFACSMRFYITKDAAFEPQHPPSPPSSCAPHARDVNLVLTN
jgi:hypothetical protein